MRLIYYPDIDTVDLHFASPRKGHAERAERGATGEERAFETVEKSQPVEVETREADQSGQTLAHYREDRLEELTIEHASRRAPAAWGVESLRREAAQVAATTGRLVESVTYDLLRDRTSFQTGDLRPKSPHTSDDAVRAFNQMIDEAKTTSAAA